MSRWSLESWKNYILDQAPGWQDNQELRNTTNQIRKNPPIVFKNEIEQTGLNFSEDGPKNLNVAVLFTDIVGFTKLSEHMKPNDVLQLLSEYQSIMVDCIFEFNGTVDKFIGDAVMANFGTPKSAGNDAQNAFDCALTMNKKLNDWNKLRNEQGLQQIEHRIGIHYGPCVFGNIGSELRTEFAVIGDPVNLSLIHISEPTRPY